MDIYARHRRELLDQINDFVKGDKERLGVLVKAALDTSHGDGLSNFDEAITASGVAEEIIAGGLFDMCGGNIEDVFERAEREVGEPATKSAPPSAVDPDEAVEVAEAIDDSDNPDDTDADESDDGTPDTGESAIVQALLGLGAGASVGRCVKQLVRIEDEAFLDRLAEHIEAHADGKRLDTGKPPQQPSPTGPSIWHRFESLTHEAHRLAEIADVAGIIDDDHDEDMAELGKEVHDNPIFGYAMTTMLGAHLRQMHEALSQLSMDVNDALRGGKKSDAA